MNNFPWYPLGRNNTSNQIARQTQATYEEYNKLKEFVEVGYFLINYVVSGGSVTKDVTFNNQIDVTSIVVSLNDDVNYREGTSFNTKIPNVTYFLDFKDGDFTWDIAHPLGVLGTDYLTIAEVTTDANGNVNVITDKRDPFGGFRLKSEYGLEDYVREQEFDALKADTTQRGLNAKSAPYNAIGNDVADDTAALQAVINAAQAVNGTVILPDGTYLFTTLSISGNVTFYSPGNAVLKQMAHAGHAINITGTAKQVKFENVTLDANHSAQAANSPNVMVYADVQGDSVTKKPHVLSFVDCDFLNICFAGISYYGDNNDTTEEHLYVNRCRFIGSQQSTDPDQKFIGVNDGSHCFITECYFDSTRDAFAAAPPYNPCAIAIQNAEPVLENRKFSRIFISENIIKNMGRNNLGAIDFYVKADKVHISNNTITDCYSGGIRGKTNSKDIVITGNTIEHIGESGIILNAWTGQVSEQNCIITDNIVLNCVQYGITLNGWDADFFKNIVVANNIVETATVGIYLIKCENVNIHHNIINECVTGIQVPAHNNKYIIIDANTLKCSTVQLNGIYIDDTTLTMYAEKITITNNIIFNYRDGMFLSRIKGMCIISDNQIYNANFNAGIYIRRTQDAHFKLLNNYVENTTGIAISLQDTIAATTAEIIGNKVMTASTYGIYTRSLTRLILEGNDVYGTTTGYYVLQVSRAIIVGNNSQNSTTSKTFTTISECIDANNSWNGFTAIP